MPKAEFIQEKELEEVLAKDGLVVVDCTATWCGPCRALSPIVDQLAGDYEGRAQVFKLDIDENKPVATKFKVKSIPAVLIFKNGELLEHMVGIAPYEKFSKAIDKNLQET